MLQQAHHQTPPSSILLDRPRCNLSGRSLDKLMELLTVIVCKSYLLTLLLISSATAQTAPAPFLPPSPAPAPAPHFVNLTDLLSVAGPFNIFLDYLLGTGVIDTFQNQANNTRQGITIFVPKNSAFASLKKSDLGDLTRDQLRSLLLYHAFPRYYSLADFKNLSRSNPVATFAGGQYALNVTDASGVIRVGSSWASPKISSSVYSTAPVAIYEIDGVLLPSVLFSTEPPIAPAPAPKEKPSPARSAGGTSADESSSGGISRSSGVRVLNRLALALVYAGLMLV